MDDEGVPGRAPRQDQLLEEASLWFARMRGPDAEEFRPAFERWLALGAAHLGAYNRAGEVFALGKFLAETPDDQSIEERNRLEPVVNWRLATVAASVLLLFGVGLWFGRDLIATRFGETVSVASTAPRDALSLTRISTQNGTRRTLALPDGSTVTLEAGSLLATNYGSERRELRLEQGRARFEVAHEKRPFVVLAGNGSVTARGTIFDVIVDSDRGVTVHLLRGAVDVERTPKAQEGRPAQPIVTRLEPGETLNFGMVRTDLVRASPIGRALEIEPPKTAGEAVEFEKAPLSQIIDRANLGAATSIRLADPSIGDLKVSGRFRIDDSDQLAERLAALFNLKVERVNEQEILLRAR
jgi:transmembrane sensor